MKVARVMLPLAKPELLRDLLRPEVCCLRVTQPMLDFASAEGGVVPLRKWAAFYPLSPS